MNVLSANTTSLCNHLANITDCFSLTQVVKQPTRIAADGTSTLIDLVLMSSPRTLKYCETVPPLANSDHLGISLQVQTLTLVRTQTKYGDMIMLTLTKQDICWLHLILPASYTQVLLSHPGKSGRMYS